MIHGDNIRGFDRKLGKREGLQWPRGLGIVEQQGIWLPDVRLEVWQEDTLRAMESPFSWAAVVTANGVGKTSVVLPLIGLAHMLAFPGCRVISTSASEAQVREQLFETNLARIVEPFVASGWRISTSSMTVTAPEVDGLVSRWIGYKCIEGGKAEGFHGNWFRGRSGKWHYCPCVYLVDEAKTTEDWLIEVVKRIGPDRLLAISSGGEETGWFFNAVDPSTLDLGVRRHKRGVTETAETGDDAEDRAVAEERLALVERRIAELTRGLSEHAMPTGTPAEVRAETRHDGPVVIRGVEMPRALEAYCKPSVWRSDTGATSRWTYRRMVSAYETREVFDAEELRMMLAEVEEKGIEDAFIQSWQLGRFMRRGGGSVVFSANDMDCLKAAMMGLNAGRARKGPRLVALDFSGGGDRQVLAMAEGSRVLSFDVCRESNELLLARRWVAMCRQAGVRPEQVIGDSGGMGSTVIKYMELDLAFGPLRRYQNNAPARHPWRFADRYTEDHWRLRRLLALSEIELPMSEDLLTESARRRVVERDGKVLKLEKKKYQRDATGESPDILDTLVMLLVDVDVTGYGEERGSSVWALGRNPDGGSGERTSGRKTGIVETGAAVGAVGEDSRFATAGGMFSGIRKGWRTSTRAGVLEGLAAKRMGRQHAGAPH